MMTGCVASIAPVGVTLNRTRGCPPGTPTRSPRTSPTAIGHGITTALAGSSTDPNARNSSTIVAMITKPAAQGRRSPSEARVSYCTAAAPPTSTSAPSGAAPHERHRRAPAPAPPPAPGQCDGDQRGAVGRPHDLRADGAVELAKLLRVLLDLCRARARGNDVQAARRGLRKIGGDPLTCDAALGALRKHPVVDAAPGDVEERQSQDDSNAVMLAAKRPGRRMTTRASRAQAPCSSSSSSETARRRRTRNASTRGPSTASRAGSTVSAATSATRTAAIAPYPIDFRKPWLKKSSADSETATVMPENSTVRPAVTMVRPRAAATTSRVLPSARISSRKRLTITASSRSRDRVRA